ncbi:MAG: CBS domain-containing protein [Anaerolineales bacterium]|nr:CBS domain-containing protein [Anaerolineales bacterium]
MLVKDLMTPNPVIISPDVSVAKAASIMETNKIRHLPVKDDKGNLIGLATRPSLNRALPGMGTGLTRFEINYLTLSTTVDEIMIKDPACIEPDAAVEEAARIMSEMRISSLLVRDGEQLVGIITDSDLFRALSSLMGARREGVRLTVRIPDEKGALAKVTNAIADSGGYLSAIGGWYPEEYPGEYGAILKIENLTREKILSAVSNLAGVVVVDLRGEQVVNNGKS